MELRNPRPAAPAGEGKLRFTHLEAFWIRLPPLGAAGAARSPGWAAGRGGKRRGGEGRKGRGGDGRGGRAGEGGFARSPRSAAHPPN